MFRNTLLVALVVLLACSAAVAHVFPIMVFDNIDTDPMNFYPPELDTLTPTESNAILIQLALGASSFNTVVNDQRWIFGIAQDWSSPYNGGMISAWSLDNANTSQTNSSRDDDDLYQLRINTTTQDGGQMQSSGSGTYQIDALWPPLDTPVAVMQLIRLEGYGAIGSTTFNFIPITSAGSTALTYADAYIVFGGCNPGVSNGELADVNNASQSTSIGFWAKDSTTQWSITTAARHAQATSDTYRMFNKGQVAVLPDVSAWTTYVDSAWISDSGSSTYIHYTDNSLGDWSLMVVGIQTPDGEDPESGWSTMRTSTGSQVVTTADQPAELMIATTYGTTGGILDGNFVSVGMGTFYTAGMAVRQGCLSAVDEDNKDTTNAWSYLGNQHILEGSDDGDATMEVVADLDAFASTSFTLDYTTAPGTAYDYGWIYFGGTSDTLAAPEAAAGGRRRRLMLKGLFR